MLAPRSLIVLTLLILGSLGVPRWGVTQELRPKIIGGEFAPLSEGPVALILTPEFSCSGTLVGAREIITAAHCADGNEPDSDYEVIVGGERVKVVDRYFSDRYDSDADPERSAPYDLAILILERSVTSTQPLPILFNDRVTRGEEIFILGYGANELSGRPERDPVEDGKIGAARVTESGGGVISSEHSTGGASACSGDSGGPALQLLNGYAVVVGALSIGENEVIAGNCRLTGDGFFSYVDLQSPTSRAFLRQFPGVRFINGSRIYLNQLANSLISRISGATRVKSSSALSQRLSQILRDLTVMRRYADGSRSSLVRAAERSIRAAQRERSFARQMKLVRSALSGIRKLSSLGVY